MEKKVAYISGPISGLQNGNVEAFALAQKKLEEQDYIVVNPHEASKEVYDKWAKLDCTTQENKDQMWKEFMIVDIRHLTLCTHVFVLPGWETSKGSNLEILIAQKLGLKIYNYKDFSEFTIDFHIVKGKPISL